MLDLSVHIFGAEIYGWKRHGSVTIINNNARLAPLLAQRSERFGDGAWFGKICSQEEVVSLAVFLFERASCQGDAVAFGSEGFGAAGSDALAGADDEGDRFAHVACWVLLWLLGELGGIEWQVVG